MLSVEVVLFDVYVLIAKLGELLILFYRLLYYITDYFTESEYKCMPLCEYFEK